MKGEYVLLNIAVLDHDFKASEMIEDLLTDRLGFNNIDVTYFQRGTELASSVSQGDFYDLIFLEIQWEKENGIETGKELRRNNLSRDTLLIFTTVSMDRILDAFDAHPYYILAKPVDQTNFIKITEQALRIIAEKNSVCQFHKGRTKIRCPLDSILWFETGAPHYIAIVTSRKTERIKGKLNDVEQMLTEMKAVNFVRVHSSYIVNMDYIEKHNMQFIQLRNHPEIIQISEKYKEHARAVLSHYLSERIL